MNNELYHYGVIGMKWGVRKNPSKAYAMAMRKSNKIEKRRAKTEAKAHKLMKQGAKLYNRYRLTDFREIGNEKMVRAHALEVKAADIAKSGERWKKAVDKTFKDYSVSKITDGNVKAGKNALYVALYGRDSYEVKKKN